MTQQTELINDEQILVKVTNEYGREIPFYDDGDGALWVLLNSMGVVGVVRARTWADAHRMAEDELYPEADETIEEIRAEYNHKREHVKIIRDLITLEEREVRPGDYPLQQGQFVRWETRETPAKEGEELWPENELFQEAYGFRPNGANSKDKHKHGIYAKDLNGDRLDKLTYGFAKELRLNVEATIRD